MVSKVCEVWQMDMTIRIRGICANPIRQIGLVLLSITVLVAMGCGGTRHHISVTSEHLPSDQESGQALGEGRGMSDKGLATDVAQDTPLSSSDRGGIGQEGMTERQESNGLIAKGRTSDDPISGMTIPEDEVFEKPLSPSGQSGKDQEFPLQDEPFPPGQASESLEGEVDLETSQLAKVAPIPMMDPPENLDQLPRTLTDVFFDYDQFGIRNEAIPVLETNAKVLIWRYPDRMVVIQGHCDERGTEEYNLILGERRAVAVKNYLMDLGVPEEKIQVISYGKEKPFCLEHTRECWQQNRRSHLLIN